MNQSTVSTKDKRKVSIDCCKSFQKYQLITSYHWYSTLPFLRGPAEPQTSSGTGLRMQHPFESSVTSLMAALCSLSTFNFF